MDHRFSSFLLECFIDYRQYKVVQKQVAHRSDKAQSICNIFFSESTDQYKIVQRYVPWVTVGQAKLRTRTKDVPTFLGVRNGHCVTADLFHISTCVCSLKSI